MASRLFAGARNLLARRMTCLSGPGGPPRGRTGRRGARNEGGFFFSVRAGERRHDSRSSPGWRDSVYSISVCVATLVQGVMKAVLLSKLKIAAAVLPLVLGAGRRRRPVERRRINPLSRQRTCRRNPRIAALPGPERGRGAGRPPNRGDTIEGQGRPGRAAICPAPPCAALSAKDQRNVWKSGPIFIDGLCREREEQGRCAGRGSAGGRRRLQEGGCPSIPDLKEPKDKEVVLDQPCC